MEKNIFLFAQSGGLFFVMFMLFFIGLAIKITVGFIYENAIEKAIVFLDKSPVENIIYKYSMNFGEEKKCKNTKAFVDNELHNWKICGIHVERFNDIGNIILGCVLFLCIIFDMVLLIGKTSRDMVVNSYMKYICFYTMITAIMLIVTKGFDTFINIKNKRVVLRDKIVNYLDNNCGADEYAMIRANIYINKESVDTDKEKIITNTSVSGQDNVEINEENKIHIGTNVNIQPEVNSEVSKQNEVKNKGVTEDTGLLQKKDKEKVIEQVLEEFLV